MKIAIIRCYCSVHGFFYSLWTFHATCNPFHLRSALNVIYFIILVRTQRTQHTSHWCTHKGILTTMENSAHKHYRSCLDLDTLALTLPYTPNWGRERGEKTKSHTYLLIDTLWSTTSDRCSATLRAVEVGCCFNNIIQYFRFEWNGEQN